MISLHSIFPLRCEWPRAVDDLATVPKDATSVRLVSGAKNIASLPAFTALKSLLCFDVNEKTLESICNCATLESLYIENIKTGNLKALKRLRNLKVLSLESCSKATSLDDIGELHHLEGLAIIHFKNVHDLAPLSEMRSLRSLAVAGSMWTKMRVTTFKALEPLVDLEYLHLTNIQAEDKSLRPLETLTSLRNLDIANFYPMREFARLSRRLLSTECTWFKPFVELKAVNCKSCKKAGSMVMLTGKGTSSLCKRCDGERFGLHVQAWNSEARTAG